MTAVATRERGILYSDRLVRAILEGRKTQTRRVVNPQPEDVWGQGLHRTGEHAGRFCLHAAFNVDGRRVDRHLRCPYGVPGDRLYVRECWRGFRNDRGSIVQYRASAEPDEWADANLGRWKPSIHMPRWASRIDQEITEVRVERIREISDDDALAEGVTLEGAVPGEDFCIDGEWWHGGPRRQFRRLWDSVNAGRGYGWDANPWVWVIGFRVLEGPR